MLINELEVVQRDRSASENKMFEIKLDKTLKPVATQDAKECYKSLAEQYVDGIL